MIEGHPASVLSEIRKKRKNLCGEPLRRIEKAGGGDELHDPSYYELLMESYVGKRLAWMNFTPHPIKVFRKNLS